MAEVILSPKASEKLTPNISEARAFVDSYLDSFKYSPLLEPPTPLQQTEVTDLTSFEAYMTYKDAYLAYKTDAFCRWFVQVVHAENIPDEDKDTVRLLVLQDIAWPNNYQALYSAKTDADFKSESGQWDYAELKEAREKVKPLQDESANINIAQQALIDFNTEKGVSVLDKLQMLKDYPSAHTELLQGLPYFKGEQRINIYTTPLDQQTDHVSGSYFKPPVPLEVVSKVLQDAVEEVEKTATDASQELERKTADILNLARLLKFKVGMLRNQQDRQLHILIKAYEDVIKTLKK